MFAKSIFVPSPPFPSCPSTTNNNNNGIAAAARPSRSPYDVTIELDKRIYNPGDTITGQVLLHLERALPCDRICARLFGSARVFFTEILKTPGPNFGKNRAYEQEAVLVDQQVELWTAAVDDDDVEEKKNSATARAKIAMKSLEEIVRQCNPNAIIRCGPSTSSSISKAANAEGRTTTGFDVGRHQLHFAFKLPMEGLHTSFDARNSAGSVRYHVLIQVFNAGFNCLRRKLLFPVVCPKRLSDPEWLQLAAQPVIEEGSDKKELLRVELHLDKRGYVPGEPLAGTVKIANNTAKSVKWMSLRIVQHTLCIATRPEFASHQSQFETSAMGLPVKKIRSGQAIAFPIRYYIPALVPEINVPGCIESEHFLQLNVGNKRGIAVELTTPLLIGTHPLSPFVVHKCEQNGEKAALPSSSVPPPIGAPPLYEEHANGSSAAILEAEEEENVSPPSYAQSVAGISLTTPMNEQQQQRDAGTVQQQQHEEYNGPLCYHYNFGFNRDGEERCNNNDDAAGGGNVPKK